ncbi:CPW-WPC family protein, putative [Plasmodium gallinaceum]|uniref:CPW-WPC family protein, putative n=1 Tax=Plasmodium gallinaceum TaxID=5849 RepID=A0A1J1GVJ6_PLAGA|nr:CPW-WPC family protein, putative [Plasmodium gallinaceum]CRG96570.1 CPW-WPC family protein, putative [Plasmodium gallinaceum]
MTKLFLYLFFLIFYFKINMCVREKKDEIFSNRELENIGGSAGDIITSSSNAPSKEQNETPDSNIAANLIKGLKNIPPPIIQLNQDNLIDPVIICEKDYNLPCPNDYNYIGSVHETEDEICAPSSLYNGPCKGEELNIKNMSEKIKETWSNKCQAFWPCKKCVRNFTYFCPEKWNKVKDTIRSCKPSELYNGPCNFQMNFSGYNIRMLEEWSLKCKAWWKCDHLNLFDECPDGDFPITPAATKWRIKKNYQ